MDKPNPTFKPKPKPKAQRKKTIMGVYAPHRSRQVWGPSHPEALRSPCSSVVSAMTMSTVNLRQITYPAPYSISWNPDVQPVLMKSKVGTSATLYHRSKKPRMQKRAWSQEFTSERPGRTAPHLKYGVFRNRRGPPPNPIPKMDIFPNVNRLKRLPSPVKRNRPTGQVTKPPQINRQGFTNRLPQSAISKVPPGVIRRVPRDVIKSVPQDVTRSVPQGGINKVPQGNITRVSQDGIKTNSSIAPSKPDDNARLKVPSKFVICNESNIYSRELSFSKVSHLDITPKVTAPPSPSFCPTPTFRTLCRKSTLTPTKYRS